MATRNRLDLRKSLWVCGATDVRNQRHAAYNVRVLQAGGTKIFMFKGKDPEELKALREILWKRDDHIVLSSWLKPYELAEIQPLLRDRKNFSVVADDWWQMPHWFTHEADYVLFRKYHGMAVRLGHLPFVNGAKPPLLLNPFFSGQFSNYLLLCSLLRLASLAAAPFREACNWRRRLQDAAPPEKYIYLPFGIDGADVPLLSEKIRYDFANTSGVFGIWQMRDPYAPAGYSFANLYHDRRRLADAIASFENDPFAIYDCRREKNYYMPWDVYLQKSQQSRYVITSGGLHDAALPKFLEYACMGVPMIGRPAPLEHPWQADVMFSVDMMGLTRKQLKPLLHQALDRQPLLRENCLKWRDRLLKLYHFDTILDMAQAQIDGRPIPSDYVKYPSKEIQTDRTTPLNALRN
jgi:hypothetical protein